METLSTQRLYIGGRHVDGTGARFETRNPATGDVLCEVQSASADDVDRAVAAAQQGFAAWSSLTGGQRGRVLLRAAALIRERADALARLEVLDTGKPIAEATSYDVQSAVEVLEYFAGVAATIRGEHVDLGIARGGAYFYTRREPLGVCAGIGAWNYPLQIASWKAAPALACGNAMIFKPSELTPLITMKLAEIFTEAGVPDGVFNVVHGAADTGRALVRHPGIAKVSLTGEVDTGKAVVADAAATLKQVTLELGGKSPLILFGDCDLDNAVRAAMNANFYTQGEVCTNGTRVFVHESIHAAFMERLLAGMSNLRIGDPMDPATNIGALISAEHRERVLAYIESGRTSGAVAHTGGTLPESGALSRGYFVRPVAFEGCTDDMKIVREEIFGPVMSILRFGDEDEVIRRANDTRYGLAAGVFTRDLNRAHRTVARLQAGICWINNYNVTPIEMPFGGQKESGLGRENGLVALDHYTQLKSVYVEGGEVETSF